MSSNATKNKNSRWELGELIDVKGPVKRVEEFIMREVRFGEKQKGDKHGVEIEFDLHGNVIELIKIDVFGVFERETCKYDKKGNEIEYCKYELVKFQTRTEALTCIEHSQYDSNGNIIEKVITKYEGKWRYEHKVIFKYTYDSNGNLTDESHYDTQGKMFWKLACRYDENSNKIEECEYDNAGVLDHKTMFKYNDNNELIKRSDYNYKGSLLRFFVYTYDNNGHMIEKRSYEPNGNLCYKWLFKYDSNGCLLEKSWYDCQTDIVLMTLNTFKYDKRGNEIERCYLDCYLDTDGKENKETKYCYKYDERGNKIETCHINSNNIQESKVYYKYDERGNKTEIIQTKGEAEMFDNGCFFEYEFWE